MANDCIHVTSPATRIAGSRCFAALAIQAFQASPPNAAASGGFTHGGWGPRYDDEVMSREMAKAMTRPGDMLLGRRTWQDFTAAWGRRTDGNPVTARMNATTKYVVSRTLKDA